MTPVPLVRLQEAGPWRTYRLTHEQARALGDGELADVRPAGASGQWRVRARKHVGAVRVGSGSAEVRLTIAPKVPVDRVLHLMGAAADAVAWDERTVDAATRPELLPAVAHAFERAAHRALQQGVLYGYREREEALSVLRGRLRAAAQLRTRPGLALPVEVTYDDHTADIPENQLLLGAARRLLRVPGIDPSVQGRLRSLIHRLAGVTPPVHGTRPPRWARNRLNHRYHQALGLAELVLRGASYELEDGRTVTVDGMLMEMWRVFETYLGTVLGQALQRRAGGYPSVQNTEYHLARGNRHPLRPDLIHFLFDPAGARRPAAVVDAKYMVAQDRDALYQMLAYCVRLGLADGHLVYVGGNANTVQIPVHGGADVRVHCHRLDLSLSPNEIDAAVTALAEKVLPT